MKGVSAGIQTWIKDIQTTKHEHSCVTENKNIQSEFKKSLYQGDGNENGWIAYILKKGNKKMS